MHTLFADGDRCPTCGAPSFDGRCNRCDQILDRIIDALRDLAVLETRAARLLAQHCQIVCRRATIPGGGYVVRWRVDLPNGRTTLMSGQTLLIVAEKRLPAGVWPPVN